LFKGWSCDIIKIVGVDLYAGVVELVDSMDLGAVTLVNDIAITVGA
jgi:hypothetical protein